MLEEGDFEECWRDAGMLSPNSLCLLCEMKSENDGDHSSVPSGGKGQVTR